ncbi:MAG: hypothetical protein EOM12_13610, partial [Verrucomicrobiae bacterium]|nr:hypothetical protein [Verrucomicrobiae bacterium]
MKSQARFPFFQSLETFFTVFPIIGKYLCVFSNHWKLFRRFFQPLETFSGFFPMIGKNGKFFSNDWKLLFGVFLVCCGGTAMGATLYVDVNSVAPTAPYTNWSTAAQTIQDAVNAAVSGDVVMVSDGVYDTGGAVAGGQLTNRVAITKAITVQSANGPGVTTIRGSGSAAYPVRGVYLGSNALLAGFTVTAGMT